MRTAAQQTEAMLSWWRDSNVTTADVAVMRDGSMMWHHGLALDALPLSWARAQNARGADVYARPARGHAWPVLFLDDVDEALALRSAAHYAALVVRTSPAGGCHLWLRCSRSLDEADRAQAQRWLATATSADPASTSGEHLGRLAGFKNWKRAGVWVNVKAATNAKAWDPDEALADARGSDLSPQGGRVAASSRSGDTSASAREWGRVCRQLENGTPADAVLEELVEMARPRRGADAERYARHTLRRALAHVGR